jgi:hypothetical protein
MKGEMPLKKTAVARQSSERTVDKAWSPHPLGANIALTFHLGAK